MGVPGPRPVEVRKPLLSSHIAVSLHINAILTLSLLLQSFFPVAVDGSAQIILAMQRQMESMASELKMLRTKVMQSEVKHDLDVQR